MYTVGDSALIMKSPRTNQWDKKTVGAAFANDNFYDIAFGAQTGVVVGDRGSVLLSNNGGDNWLPESSGVSSTLRGVVFNRSSGRMWAVGDNGVIIRSDDTARTWKPQTSGTTATDPRTSPTSTGPSRPPAGARAAITGTTAEDCRSS